MRLELYDLEAKKAYISDGKYSLPNLHFSLFSFPKTIHDTPPGTSPPLEGLGEAVSLSPFFSFLNNLYIPSPLFFILPPPPFFFSLCNP
jgi:hypothetical protein